MERFWAFSSFCAFEMHASPAVLVAEIATEVLQGPTSTFAAHSSSSLGRSQEETSCSGGRQRHARVRELGQGLEES